ncbi:MAG: hypothetical protein EXS31_05905 [Pedosphaera sp.]|nr:hypothetical protein [Pedosphaera sp.]
MTTRIIKREDLAQVVNDWGSGRMSSTEVLNWANALYPSDEVDYDDWEEDNSVTNEILAALDMLDMNLALPEDVAVYLEFLSHPSASSRAATPSSSADLMRLIMTAAGHAFAKCFHIRDFYSLQHSSLVRRSLNLER